MRQLEGDVGGVDVYFLGQSPESIEPEDLVADRECAVGVYYLSDEYPRFRVAFTDDMAFDGSSAVVVLSELVEFFASRKILDASIFLMSHGMGEPEFRAWEKEFMSIPFMKSQGCDFLAEAKGEWSV